MPTRYLLGWSFKSDLSHGQMLKALNADWKPRWEEGDSARSEYIYGTLTKEAKTRIYRTGPGAYTANLVFFSKEGDVDAQVAEATKILLEKVMPLVGARDVERTPAHDP